MIMTNLIVRNSRPRASGSKQLAAAIFGMVCITMTAMCCAQADDGAAPNQRRERASNSRQAKLLTESSARVIIKAQEALEEKQFAAALELLDSLLVKGERLNDYDRAKTLQFVAYVYLSQDKYKEAIDYSERALALAALDDGSTLDLRYSLATLYLFSEDYLKSAAHLQSWLGEIDNPNAQALFMAAQLYALLEQYGKAATFADSGMANHYAESSFSPNQDWHRLQLAIFLNLKQYDRAIPLLKVMIAYWPDQYQYYQQLAALLLELNSQQRHNAQQAHGGEQASLAVLSIAYQNNLLARADDYERLLQLYRLQNYPAKGAEIYAAALTHGVLEKSAQQLESLSNAWLHAREWSLANAYLTQAAAKSDNGKNWLLLCQTSAQDEQWRQSIQYCRKAIDKGGLNGDTGTAWQLIALAHYHQNDLNEAIAAFQRCASWPATRDDCTHWRQSIQDKVAFNEQERERLEQEQQVQQRRKEERLELIRNL